MTDRELIQAAKDMATIGCADCRKQDCPIYREVPADMPCDDFLLLRLADRLEAVSKEIIV